MKDYLEKLRKWSKKACIQRTREFLENKLISSTKKEILPRNQKTKTKYQKKNIHITWVANAGYAHWRPRG